MGRIRTRSWKCVLLFHSYQTKLNMNLKDKNPDRRFEILLVDDSVSDIKLAEEVLAMTPVKKNVQHVIDGIQALAFLRRQEP